MLRVLGCALTIPYQLNPPLSESLHLKGYFFLIDVSKKAKLEGWIQYWLSAIDLNMEDDLVEEWYLYVKQSKHNDISLNDHEDELSWSKDKNLGLLQLSWELKH